MDNFGRPASLSAIPNPAVMGILNLTEDSFFDGGDHRGVAGSLLHTERMLKEGASIIDVGAVSTRPGALPIPEEEERATLTGFLTEAVKSFPNTLFSVDTFRAEVARAACECGAGMVNDIYGGRYGDGMLDTVAQLGVPYVLMHMKGTPATMQQNPTYSDVVAEVNYFFEQQTLHCRNAGIREVILDPGFGFGKTADHNYTLLSRLESVGLPGHRLLVGISRKSMIYKILETNPREALNGTTVLNTIALLHGANILRVHDVKEAMEAIRLVCQLPTQEEY